MKQKFKVTSKQKKGINFFGFFLSFSFFIVFVVSIYFFRFKYFSNFIRSFQIIEAALTYQAKILSFFCLFEVILNFLKIFSRFSFLCFSQRHILSEPFFLIFDYLCQ